MRRITVDEVRDAIARTGIALQRRVTYRGPSNGKPACGCPIGAIAVEWFARGGQEVPASFGWDMVFGSIGLDGDYARSFTRGFDGVRLDEDYDQSLLGFEDGLAVAEALLPTKGVPA